ncbi:MAG: hypothetical protein WCS37_10405 [Chloroflexota bacterium]
MNCRRVCAATNCIRIATHGQTHCIKCLRRMGAANGEVVEVVINEAEPNSPEREHWAKDAQDLYPFPAGLSPSQIHTYAAKARAKHDRV